MADEGETPTSWWDARGLQNNPINLGLFCCLKVIHSIA